MKKIFSYLSLALLIFSFYSCETIDVGPGTIIGKGEVISEERTVTGFSGIDLQMSADVYLSHGPDYNVRVEAQENILKIIKTEEENGILKIDNSQNTMKNKRVKVYVTAPTYNSIMISGSGDVFVTDAIAAHTLNCYVEGSGNLTAKVALQHLNVNMKGSGQINMEGSVPKADFIIKGSGDFLGRKLQAEVATVDLSGSGDIEIAVNKEINGKISGSGDLTYEGNPQVSMTVKGSGKIKRF